MILALAVVIAVIIFGGLISVGNERQRRAIDGLREQVVQWALQDLRIKREKLAREVRVENPLEWLNHLTTKVVGNNLQLEVSEVFDEPRALVCHSADGGKAVFTPVSPVSLQKMSHARQNRLAQKPVDNPLLSLNRGVRKYHISVLNGGMMFDLELLVVWKALTEQQVDEADHLWIYLLE